MEVHFAPGLQAKIDQLVIETGRGLDKLLEDAMAGYVANSDRPAKCSTVA